MQTAELQPGVVVYDAGLKSVPHERRFFKVVKGLDAEVGPWVLEQVSSRQQRTVQLGQVDKLQLVDAEPFIRANFDGLIGRQVTVHTRWGSKISGVVGVVETFEFTIGGEMFKLPQALVIGGDPFELKDIVEVSYGTAKDSTA